MFEVRDPDLRSCTMKKGVVVVGCENHKLKGEVGCGREVSVVAIDVDNERWRSQNIKSWITFK